MNRIIVFDTSLVTENIGDFIVMDYCNSIVNSLFQNDFLIKVPTHERLSDVTYTYAKQSKYKIVCGTNLLTGQMRKHNQWKLKIRDTKYIDDVCLLGVGWRKYGEEPDLYSRFLWGEVLSHRLLHSVRDSYTECQLRKMGFDNVLNTGCPTMWGLTEDHCRKIPTKKSGRVLMTTTRYNHDMEKDNVLLDILLRQYKIVYYWLQSYEDYDYASKLENGSHLVFIPPRLDALDQLLKEDDLDYCGTRLHAGIRALNFGKRSIIIATDNRAIEIAKDTGLPICLRDDVDKELEHMISNEHPTHIRLQWDNISRWKSQFTGGGIIVYYSPLYSLKKAG